MKERKILDDIKPISKKVFIDWLSEHRIAFEDFCNYFKLDVNDENIADKFSLEEAADWISEHKQLAKDFICYFNGNALYDDICDVLDELFNI